MMSNPQYNEAGKRLIFEIIVRLIAEAPDALSAGELVDRAAKVLAGIA